jgi:uncharacterized membrane protein (DUF485 family)
MPASPDPRIDWEAVERSPEFRELVAARRRFVLPATIFFLVWYLGFVLLAGYAPDFMARSVYQGLTVGYCLALTQFVMVFTLGYLYLRRADTVYDPMAAKVIEQAVGDPYAALPGAGAGADRPSAPPAPPASDPRAAR